ncbi:MAG TPA: hypothetical protein VFB13_02000 [Reyranella sp.]|nr:hypothetical protein [Reyranella sp.]
MNALGCRGLPAVFVSLMLSTAAAAAADFTMLDRPGAVHLKPSTAAPPKASSGFSFIPPASAAQAPMGSSANTTQVPAVRLTGYIMPGDGEKLRDMLDTIASYPAAKADGPLTTIELSSMGGSLLDGFQIGSLMRKYHLIAVVRSHDLCLSSCALALVGGNVQDVPQSYPTRCNIEIGGKVGFHNFFLNPAALRDGTANDPVASRMQGFSDARGGAAALVKYAAQMGLPPSFVASLIGRPADDFEYVQTVGQFLSLGLCPVGIQRPSVPLEVQAANVCSNSMRHADPNPQLSARLLPADQVRRHLLERLQAQMLASRARGRLAALLANGAVMRVGAETDRLYDDLRSSGASLPEIVGPTYEVTLNGPAGAEPACYVSLSPDDPDSYDVVINGTKGLSSPPNLPPDNARRLFLFNKQTIINPRPQ